MQSLRARVIPAPTGPRTLGSRHARATRGALAALLILAFFSLLPISAAVALPLSDAGLTLRVDPTFDPQNLSPAERLWYDRALASIEITRDDIESRARQDDLYTYGRSVGDYTAALLMALRATGDRRFLDRVAELSEIYRSKLADAWDDGTTDGFLNWRWREDPGSPYYGTDLHQMDEAMTHGNVGLVAYAFQVNRDIDPSYAAKADFWRDYLENHFLAKWTARAGGDPVAAWEDAGLGFYKRLTHPRANQLRLAYYLWKITGNDFYRQRAEVIATQLLNHVELNPDLPTAYRWKHQVTGSDLGWQWVNYAHYFMFVVMEMHLEGYLGYADDSEMQRYASTFRDVVYGPFAPLYVTMRDRVYGQETTSALLYQLDGFGRWDASGTLLAIAGVLYTPGLDGLSTAACGLMAVSQRAAGAPASALETSGASGPILLWPSSPEPFRGQTAIRFELLEPGPAEVAIYDVAGRLTRVLLSGEQAKGPHAIVWDGRTATGENAPAGTYFSRLRSGSAVRTNRLTLLR